VAAQPTAPTHHETGQNYFAHRGAANRYDYARPFFHPLVIGKIREKLELREPLGRALDVACGTGQSAKALRAIAASVVGTDLSMEMLGVVSRGEGMAFVAAPAERLPFATGVFDLVTVALAFHWFDAPSFLREASRVLSEQGWLVIYNNWWTARMKENPRFEEWAKGEYISRYPTPPRNRHTYSDEEFEELGFRVVGRERYENEVGFSVEEMAAYLTTQSNVIAAVERGGESLAEVGDWLTRAVVPFFTRERMTFPFAGSIEYLRKQ
jgi:SAM-dependent methyltransferase